MEGLTSDYSDEVTDGDECDQSTRKLTPLERQRDELVGDVIRYGGGFRDRAGCFTGCDSHLTAKTPDGRRACPWHWPVTQLGLFA